ncbi:MAG TPA: NADP-dependent malic enzyme [Patescibacteria group bacterium]|nr:NADP-dependent malic enzyme [Patescibacteria group bacterium]
MNYKKLAMTQHKKLRGKIGIELKDSLDNPDKLSTYYTPGVGAVSKYLAENPNEARNYTWLNNSVAVISDGSSVLGLGNIGPQAALPVMEGKCMLFKRFAGIDAVPIVLNVHKAEDIVSAVMAIAPTFGGINLEDIAAPICFEVEKKLKDSLQMPIMHDDQHGTAIVVLAGLINSIRLAEKDLNDCRMVVNGVGAAGVAIIKLVKRYAPGIRIIAVDSNGIITDQRKDLNSTKQELIEKRIIMSNLAGDLSAAMTDSDIFIGVSRAKTLTRKMVRSMNNKGIIFAMANPEPEILPDDAKKAGAFIIATGRSDFPNQVNNALAFPGIFRGALDNNLKRITLKHKIAAAKAISELVQNPTPEYIIPSVLDKNLVPAITKVIT